MKSWRFDRSDPMKSRAATDSDTAIRNRVSFAAERSRGSSTGFGLVLHATKSRSRPHKRPRSPRGTRGDDRGKVSETREMASSRTHAPGAEGAPLLASDLASTPVKPPLGRADRDRVTSARLVSGVAIALLVACVGAFGSIAVAARAGGAAGAVVTSASALGSVTPRDSAVDPMEASGARPMSAYGTIDEHSPMMRALGEDPVEAAAAAFLDDATLGERERPGAGASSDAARTAPRTEPEPQTSSSAASVQADVDSQIEIEMRRLDEAARAMDAERATRRARDERTAADAEPAGPAGRGSNAAELAGGERASSSNKASLRDEDAPSDDASAAKKHKRHAARDSKDSKAAAAREPREPRELERASLTPVAVSETKDRYARAVDAALASETDASTDASIGSASVSTDLSALNVLEPVQNGGSTPINQANQASSVPSRGVVPAVAAGACDFARCDAAAGPQVFDETCVSLGGLGCIGQTGCRFCKAGAIGEAGLATCPPCVCQAMGVAGCASGGGGADGALRMGGVGKAEATTAANDFDGGVPVDVASRVVAAPAALTTEGAVRASPEALTRPDEAEAQTSADAAAAAAATPSSPFSVAGVSWLLTPFGFLESCAERCARARMRCDDTRFPSSFQDFVSVVGATNPESGRDDVCASVLENDPSRHCVFPLYALSGRCYRQPNRAPSCVTAEDAHADCQHFCPCVK